MATLAEIAGITENASYGAFVEKIRSAVVIKATSIVDDVAATPAAISWARRALTNPASAAEDGIIFYVVGDNATFTIAQILGANDATIQSAVNAAVTKIAEIS